MRPPGSRVEAIPELATAKAISCCCLTLASTNFITKVFPVPPGASRKYIPPFLPATFSIIVVNAIS